MTYVAVQFSSHNDTPFPCKVSISADINDVSIQQKIELMYIFLFITKLYYLVLFIHRVKIRIHENIINTAGSSNIS